METTPEELASARAFHEPHGPYPDPTGDEFDLYFQITSEILWPKVWLNDGLDARTRSLCVVAALTALGRPQVGKHIRAALDHGATKTEIAQVLTQMAFYTGWPAAGAAIRQAQDVFREIPDV
ncbi:MAG TPA: carboxymuconolactone decarboxylase family protein [Jatrophihabitantaceae bacterium]|jgi:4-carboxymuconolactone decarboxylase|nr:carboxymuconolactone decarboxylase family protein [Jatrophihabitantaceae bacterium]